MKNEPILYNGEEFKDKFMTRTNLTPSLKMRLEFLFCGTTYFETETYCKEIMPAEKTICHVNIVPIWRLIKAWFMRNRGYGEMVKLDNEMPCDIQ